MLRLSLLLLLSGCAPYWHKALPAVPVERVEHVDNARAFCGQDAPLWGCTVRFPGYAVIYLQAGMPPEMEKCALSHELAHAQGWVHDDRPTYKLDCGP